MELHWQLFYRGRGGFYWYRGGVFWRALTAWLVGFAITIPFIASATLPWSGQTWEGPVAQWLGGMDISGIIGAIVSGLLYFLLGRSYFKHVASEAVTVAASNSQ